MPFLRAPYFSGTLWWHYLSFLVILQNIPQHHCHQCYVSWLVLACLLLSNCLLDGEILEIYYFTSVTWSLVYLSWAGTRVSPLISVASFMVFWWPRKYFWFCQPNDLIWGKLFCYEMQFRMWNVWFLVLTGRRCNNFVPVIIINKVQLINVHISHRYIWYLLDI